MWTAWRGPTVDVPAPAIADAADPALAPRLVGCTRLANLVRLAAVSLPVGGGSPPVGLQVTARVDSAALAAAWWIERALSSA